MKTDKSILITYGGRSLEDVPESVRQRIESRPRLRQAFLAQARVAGWMALKRYETPDPAIEGRLTHRVMLRIRNGDFPLEDAPGFVLPEWARMVAVVVCMLGLSVLTHREMLTGDGVPAPSLASPSIPPLENTSLSRESFLVRNVDPFTSLIVADDGLTPAPVFSDALNRQVLDSFELFPLLEKNRSSDLGLLPVRQPFTYK